MNYEEMSDFEIAECVLQADGYVKIASGDRFEIYNSPSNRRDVGEKASNKFKFDPCNNPSDAWPIMLTNGIGAYRSGAEWTCGVNISYGNFEHETSHGNPLRAAMIVFLMMKDAQNV